MQLSSPIESAQLTKIHSDDEVSNAETPKENVDDEQTEDVFKDAISVEVTDDSIADKDTQQQPVHIEESIEASTDSKIESEPPAEADTLIAANDGSVCVFCDVEVGQATLSIDAFDLDITLGSSIAYDLKPFTSDILDLLKPESGPYTVNVPIPILPPGSSTNSTKDEAILPAEAVCSVTLKLEYQPAEKDKRDLLFEKLASANEKKTAAIEVLRELTQVAAKYKTTTKEESKKGGDVSKPLIKPGFLNKEKPKPEDTNFLKKVTLWYERNLGPASIVGQLVPMAKNYVLFFGFIAIAHYRGHSIALPAPV